METPDPTSSPVESSSPTPDSSLRLPPPFCFHNLIDISPSLLEALPLPCFEFPDRFLFSSSPRVQSYEDSESPEATKGRVLHPPNLREILAPGLYDTFFGLQEEQPFENEETTRDKVESSLQHEKNESSFAKDNLPYSGTDAKHANLNVNTSTEPDVFPETDTPRVTNWLPRECDGSLPSEPDLSDRILQSYKQSCITHLQLNSEAPFREESLNPEGAAWLNEDTLISRMARQVVQLANPGIINENKEKEKASSVVGSAKTRERLASAQPVPLQMRSRETVSQLGNISVLAGKVDMSLPEDVASSSSVSLSKKKESGAFLSMGRVDSSMEATQTPPEFKEEEIAQTISTAAREKQSQGIRKCDLTLKDEKLDLVTESRVSLVQKNVLRGEGVGSRTRAKCAQKEDTARGMVSKTDAVSETMLAATESCVSDLSLQIREQKTKEKIKSELSAKRQRPARKPEKIFDPVKELCETVPAVDFLCNDLGSWRTWLAVFTDLYKDKYPLRTTLECFLYVSEKTRDRVNGLTFERSHEVLSLFACPSSRENQVNVLNFSKNAIKSINAFTQCTNLATLHSSSKNGFEEWIAHLLNAFRIGVLSALWTVPMETFDRKAPTFENPQKDLKELASDQYVSLHDFHALSMSLELLDSVMNLLSSVVRGFTKLAREVACDVFPVQTTNRRKAKERNCPPEKNDGSLKNFLGCLSDVLSTIFRNFIRVLRWTRCPLLQEIERREQLANFALQTLCIPINSITSHVSPAVALLHSLCIPRVMIYNSTTMACEVSARLQEDTTSDLCDFLRYQVLNSMTRAVDLDNYLHLPIEGKNITIFSSLVQLLLLSQPSDSTGLHETMARISQSLCTHVLSSFGILEAVKPIDNAANPEFEERKTRKAKPSRPARSERIVQEDPAVLQKWFDHLLEDALFCATLPQYPHAAPFVMHLTNYILAHCVRPLLQEDHQERAANFVPFENLTSAQRDKILYWGLHTLTQILRWSTIHSKYFEEKAILPPHVPIHKTVDPSGNGIEISQSTSSALTQVLDRLYDDWFRTPTKLLELVETSTKSVRKKKHGKVMKNGPTTPLLDPNSTKDYPEETHRARCLLFRSLQSELIENPENATAILAALSTLTHEWETNERKRASESETKNEILDFAQHTAAAEFYHSVLHRELRNSLDRGGSASCIALPPEFWLCLPHISIEVKKSFSRGSSSFLPPPSRLDSLRGMVLYLIFSTKAQTQNVFSHSFTQRLVYALLSAFLHPGCGASLRKKVVGLLKSYFTVDSSAFRTLWPSLLRALRDDSAIVREAVLQLLPLCVRFFAQHTEKMYGSLLKSVLEAVGDSSELVAKRALGVLQNLLEEGKRKQVAGMYRIRFHVLCELLKKTSWMEADKVKIHRSVAETIWSVLFSETDPKALGGKDNDLSERSGSEHEDRSTHLHVRSRGADEALKTTWDQALSLFIHLVCADSPDPPFEQVATESSSLFQALACILGEESETSLVSNYTSEDKDTSTNKQNTRTQAKSATVRQSREHHVQQLVTRLLALLRDLHNPTPTMTSHPNLLPSTCPKGSLMASLHLLLTLVPHALKPAHFSSLCSYLSCTEKNSATSPQASRPSTDEVVVFIHTCGAVKAVITSLKVRRLDPTQSSLQNHASLNRWESLSTLVYNPLSRVLSRHVGDFPQRVLIQCIDTLCGLLPSETLYASVDSSTMAERLEKGYLPALQAVYGIYNQYYVRLSTVSQKWTQASVQSTNHKSTGSNSLPDGTDHNVAFVLRFLFILSQFLRRFPPCFSSLKPSLLSRDSDNASLCRGAGIYHNLYTLFRTLMSHVEANENNAKGKLLPVLLRAFGSLCIARPVDYLPLCETVLRQSLSLESTHESLSPEERTALQRQALWFIHDFLTEEEKRIEAAVRQEIRRDREKQQQNQNQKINQTNNPQKIPSSPQTPKETHNPKTQTSRTATTPFLPP